MAEGYGFYKDDEYSWDFAINGKVVGRVELTGSLYCISMRTPDGPVRLGNQYSTLSEAKRGLEKAVSA